MVLFNLLLTSAAEMGFAWDGGERGWVRVSLPPLAYDGWSYSAFPLCYFGCRRIFMSCPNFLSGKVFGARNLLILKALYNYLTRPT